MKKGSIVELVFMAFIEFLKIKYIIVITFFLNNPFLKICIKKSMVDVRCTLWVVKNLCQEIIPSKFLLFLIKVVQYK